MDSNRGLRLLYYSYFRGVIPPLSVAIGYKFPAVNGDPSRLLLLVLPRSSDYENRVADSRSVDSDPRGRDPRTERSALGLDGPPVLGSLTSLVSSVTSVSLTVGIHIPTLTENGPRSSFLYHPPFTRHSGEVKFSEGGHRPCLGVPPGEVREVVSRL